MPPTSKMELDFSASTRNLINGLRQDVQSIGEAINKLAETPPIDIVEPMPFHCPSCGKLHPTITVLEEGGSGPSDQFVLKAECENCHSPIYGIPRGWEVFSNREQTVEALKP